MQQLIRLVEPPRTCSYLPDETAALEIRAIADLSAAEYADLLARGYRRFGWQLFRPACPACRKCRSVRVLIDEFTPSRNHARVLRRNAAIRAELHALFVTPEHVKLYNVYHQFMSAHRGWAPQETTLEDYAYEFLSGSADTGRQWLYFDGRQLVGVALMDEVPGAISLVYFFYHPEWRALSPGTFSIVNQLLYAKRKNLEYAYPGYWIESCSSMSYKGRFRPHEILREYPRDDESPVWERA